MKGKEQYNKILTATQNQYVKYFNQNVNLESWYHGSD